MPLVPSLLKSNEYKEAYLLSLIRSRDAVLSKRNALLLQREIVDTREGPGSSEAADLTERINCLEAYLLEIDAKILEIQPPA